MRFFIRKYPKFKQFSAKFHLRPAFFQRLWNHNLLRGLWSFNGFLQDHGVILPHGTNAKGQQVWGWNEPALAGWNICPFIWSFGGALTNEDQTAATGYVNSEATIKAVETFAELVKAGGITGFNSGDIPMTDGFGTGRYAMMLEGPWKSAELAGAYPDVTYGTAPIPAGEGGSISLPVVISLQKC